VTKSNRDELKGHEEMTIRSQPFLCADCGERTVEVVQLMTGMFIFTCDECGWEREVRFEGEATK
jgi:hypothetical protein